MSSCWTADAFSFRKQRNNVPSYSFLIDRANSKPQLGDWKIWDTQIEILSYFLTIVPFSRNPDLLTEDFEIPSSTLWVMNSKWFVLWFCGFFHCHKQAYMGLAENETQISCLGWTGSWCKQQAFNISLALAKWYTERWYILEFIDVEIKLFLTTDTSYICNNCVVYLWC